MKRVLYDTEVYDHSYAFEFTPSELAQNLYYYPTACGHYYCTANYHKKRDYYPPLLLIYVIYGDFFLSYRANTYFVGKGEAFLIDCREPHYYHAGEKLEFLYCHFDGSDSHKLCEHIMANQGVVYSGEKAREIGSLLYTFVDHHRKGEYMDAPAQSLFIYRLMTAAMSRSINKAPDEDPIEITVKYIRENVGQAISLDQLASMACLSKYHFSRLFKKETGYSPMEFVIGTRLDRAKILLRISNKTVSEIAGEVGYENPGSFINLFSKKVGQSPNTFRKS